MSTDRSYYRSIKTRRRSYLRYGVTLFQKALDQQIRPAIAAIRKGYQQPQTYIDNQPIDKAMRQLYTSVMPSFGENSRQRFKSSMNDYKTKEEIDIPEANWEQILASYIEMNLTAKIAGITATSSSWIKKQFEKAVIEGLSIDETATLIMEGWEGISRYRAVMIARTEIISASNAGNFLGAKSLNIPMNKIWLTTTDGRERASHGDVNNTKIPLDSLYIVGGIPMRYPGDPNGGADNVINCRCAERYEPI